jgi:hypothetical protein
VLKNIPFTGMQMRFGYQRVSEREICSFSRVRVCVCVLQRCSGVALGGVCENTTSGNSDNTTARKSKQSVTRYGLLLISFNCFLKKRKKAKEAKTMHPSEEEKNETMTTRRYYHHLRTFYSIIFLSRTRY